MYQYQTLVLIVFILLYLIYEYGTEAFVESSHPIFLKFWFITLKKNYDD